MIPRFLREKLDRSSETLTPLALFGTELWFGGNGTLFQPVAADDTARLQATYTFLRMGFSQPTSVFYKDLYDDAE